ncbi:MAG: zinc ribbon domain-containing protein [Clostridia bacterium]|nr:zinc ribbon domain-containing protein [Clostridia bacterium]
MKGRLNMNFDDIANKAKETFEDVYKKAETVVNVQKQKIDVYSLESKLSKSYEILGKLCYDAIKNDEPFDAESVKPVTDDIAEKIALIEATKEEILKTKNKKLCTKCGTQIEKNAVFCSKCGAKL